jgi:hypothetical protein
LDFETWDIVWGVRLGHHWANISGETLLRREINPATDAPPIQAQLLRTDKSIPRVTYPVSTGFLTPFYFCEEVGEAFFAFAFGVRQECHTYSARTDFETGEIENIARKSGKNR